MAQPRNAPHSDPDKRGRSSGEAMERCSELEAAIDALKVRYEQYFLGVHRQPPNEDHAAVRSAILKLKNASVRNTAVRFRVQSLHNRFLSYERMWQRTIREIEDGTYRRDLAKLKRRKTQPRGPLVRPDDFDVDEDVSDADSEGDSTQSESHLHNTESATPGLQPEGADAVKRGVSGSPPARSAAAAAARANTQRDAFVPEEKMRAVYEAYVGAKKRCRENVDGLTYEAVSSALRRQVPTLLEKHKASRVDFKVVIKDGKAILKAVPR